jgi:hypothetical protein
MTRFKVGDRLRSIHASYLPTATVTEITERGFRYVLDKPVLISPRIGTQTGGESYTDDQWKYEHEGKGGTGWSDKWPHKADAGDEYYFVRRKDRDEVVVMGFSMGQAWLNGVAYEQDQMQSHLFLGPLSPSDTEQLIALRAAAEKALARLEENESWWRDLVPRFKDDVFWRATFEARQVACKRDVDALRHALGVGRED